MLAKDDPTHFAAFKGSRSGAVILASCFVLFSILAISALQGEITFEDFHRKPGLDVDIDIGTAGEPIRSNRLLVTFDPFGEFHTICNFMESDMQWKRLNKFQLPPVFVATKIRKCQLANKRVSLTLLRLFLCDPSGQFRR